MEPVQSPSVEAAGAPAPAASPDGELRVAISNAIVHLYREYSGKGPTRARTYLMDDLVAVVLRGTSTRLEDTLTQAGNGARVRDFRQAFQDSLQNMFVQRIEELTGRRVQAFLSQSSIEPDVAVELFLLEPDPRSEA